MINVGMGEKDGAQIFNLEGKVSVFLNRLFPVALEKAAVK
jgi:hypothetical protein